MRKYSVLLAAALLLLLVGCQNSAPAPTGPAETTPVTEPVTVPETTSAPELTEPETEPYLYYDIFPKFEDPEWELQNPEYGLYRYTGDMDKIELNGYSLSIPEKWQDKVSVLRGDPAGHDDLVYVVGNALTAAYVENAERHPDGSIIDLSFRDCIINIALIPKEDLDRIGASDAIENGNAVLAGEDGGIAYYVCVRKPKASRELGYIQEELVGKIGQEAYDALLDGLDCTLEEAAAMISVGE